MRERRELARGALLPALEADLEGVGERADGLVGVAGGLFGGFELRMVPVNEEVHQERLREELSDSLADILAALACVMGIGRDEVDDGYRAGRGARWRAGVFDRKMAGVQFLVLEDSHQQLRGEVIAG